jgi:predicted nucleic acid-binding protein
MIVVSDTSPLNYLILIEATHLLPALFGRVYTPQAVIQELTHRGSPEAVRLWATAPADWLSMKEPAHIDPSLKLGPGETAAIALAEELKADWVLVDERKGSREALKRGFRVAGTFSILEEAGARGLVDYTNARDRLVNQTNIYVTEDVLRQSEQRYFARKQTEEQVRNPQGQPGQTQEQAEQKLDPSTEG